jgi:probable addiction module antidote protein
MDMKAETKTQTFDPAKYLSDAESQIQFLEAAFKSNQAGDIAFALSVLAKIKGMTEVAKEVGVTPETLYKSLTRGNPRLSTFTDTVRALGYKLKLEILDTVPRI